MNKNKMNSLMKHILKWQILLLSIAFLPYLSNAEDKKFTVKHLEKELLHGAEGDLNEFVDVFSKAYIFRAVVELDTVCIPTLTTALSSDSRIRKVIGGVGLGMIGNNKALENLGSIAIKTNEDYILSIYFKAISGRGMPSDLSFLMQTVKDKKNTALSCFAAYALAVHRSRRIGITRLDIG